MEYDITYERDIYKSYMKIPSPKEGGLDERVILERKWEGVSACKKCYVGESGEYWYDISGKQALDYYCKLHAVGREFFERLILSICNQMEVLEWNLVDVGCIRLDPELIFLNQSGEEIYFVLYPEKEMDVWWEFQRLIEYLLTKLDHSGRDVTKWAYDIYAMTMMDGYSVAKIKQRILDARKEEISKNETYTEKTSVVTEIDLKEERQEENSYQKPRQIESLLHKKMEKGKGILEGSLKHWMKEKMPVKDSYVEVMYPEDEFLEEKIQIHPTVCITNLETLVEGRLIYEGIGKFCDVDLLKEESFIIGKNIKANLVLDKETISQLHAKIEYTNGNYYIEDMNSTNGTYVNDVLLSYKQRQMLKNGDVLCFADVKYRFI